MKSFGAVVFFYFAFGRSPLNFTDFVKIFSKLLFAFQVIDYKIYNSKSLFIERFVTAYKWSILGERT